MEYLTLDALTKMDKTEIVYVRKMCLYAHKVRIQQNAAQFEACKIIQKAIDASQSKKHIDYVYAKMSVADVLFVFEKYFNDYRNLVIKCTEESIPTTEFLELDDSSKDKVIVASVFKTKEQEKLFSECAEKSMSTTAFLKW